MEETATRSGETTHVSMVTSLCSRSSDVNERGARRGTCMSSAVVDMIVVVIDLALLSFVPYVILRN